MNNTFMQQMKGFAATTFLGALMAMSQTASAGDMKAKGELLAPAQGTVINSGKEFTMKIKVTNTSNYTLYGPHMGMPADKIKVDIKIDGKVATTVSFDLTADLMQNQSVVLEKKVKVDFSADKTAAQFCTAISVNGAPNPDAGASPCGSVQQKVFPTSVANVSNDAAISLYPNPATTEIHISSEKEINGSVVVFDLAGKAVAQQNVNGKAATVSVGHLAAGSYLYRIADEAGAVLQNGKLSIK